MLPVEIRAVQTRRQRRMFVRSAWRFNEADPLWVPPLVADQVEYLDPRRGVFFDHGEAQLFMAWRDGRPAGRISAHVSYEHDRRFGPGTGFVGFFECEDSRQTAAALFGAAEEWLRAKGRPEAQGPFSFGVYDEIGVLVDGFDSPPYVLTTHNPPYYGRLFEECGWEKAVDWYGFRGRQGTTDARFDQRRVLLAERVLKRRGLAVRTVDLRHHLDREAAIVYDLFAAAWDRNWGHVPPTEREWERLKAAVRRMVIPELSLVVELEGKPVAFTLSIADANVAVKRTGGRLFPFGWLTLLTGMRRTDRFRLILMGVLEPYRNQGIENALYARVIAEGVRLGLREVETSLIVETNEQMMSSIGRLAVERYKTWRIYRKALGR
jgi:GNAT superfamily N-acetyltransferase